MGILTHDRFGHDWTLSEAQTFVQHCYDRDALLETLINFGSTWLKGRLICLVTHQQIQPFMARGWASWGDDQETTEEFTQNKLLVKATSVIATVIKEGTYTFGSPEVLGIEELFNETSVLAPEHVMVLPIQIGSSTKMIFFGEPAFDVTDLMAFSEQAEPLVILADDIAEQLEEIIRLGKARKLPPSHERIPSQAKEAAPAAALPTTPEEHPSTPTTAELSLQELEDTLNAAHDALLNSDAEISNPLDIPKSVQAPSEPSQVKPRADVPGAAILSRKTRQLQRPEDLKPNPTQTSDEPNRPRPISYDPDDMTGLRGEPTGVDIIKPIGISDQGFQAKQTLLGGFSIADVQRAISGQGVNVAPTSKHPTLQGISAAKRQSAPSTTRAEQLAHTATAPYEQAPHTELEELQVEGQAPQSSEEDSGRHVTRQIKITDDILVQDIKNPPSTKRLYAVEQRTLLVTPQPEEQPPAPREETLFEAITKSAQPEAPAQSPEPPQATSIEEDVLLNGTTLDILEPTSLDQESESEVEALPTLEIELMPSDEQEEAAQILGAMVSGVSYTGQHKVIEPEASLDDEDDELQEGVAPASTQRLHTISPKSHETPVHYRQPAATEEVVAIDVSLFIDKLNDRNPTKSFAIADEAIPHPPLIKALVAQFPGRLYKDRYGYPPDRLPPIEEHGPVLRALVKIGSPILGFIDPLFESGSLEVRFYATYLMTKIPAGQHLPHLVDRIFDRDLQTREIAKVALSHNINHKDLEAKALQPLRQQLEDPSLDEVTLELVVDTLGRLRDKQSIPALIKSFNQRRARTSQIIHRALQRITLQPLPASQVAWNNWWSSAQYEPRQEWILRALNSPTDPIREMVAEELRLLNPPPTHYDPHHPPQLRQHAQQELKRYFETHNYPPQA